MGAISADITSNAQWEPTLLTFEITPGELNSIIIFATDAFVGSAQGFAEIGLLGAESDINTRTVVLASGYMGTLQTLSFVGHFPVYPGDVAFASIMSGEADKYRLVVRITPEHQLRGRPNSV